MIFFLLSQFCKKITGLLCHHHYLEESIWITDGLSQSEITIPFGMSFLIITRSLIWRTSWEAKWWPHVGEASRSLAFDSRITIIHCETIKGEMWSCNSTTYQVSKVYSKQMYLDFPVMQVSAEWAFSFTDSDMSTKGIIISSVFIRKAFQGWQVAHHTGVPPRLRH